MYVRNDQTNILISYGPIGHLHTTEHSVDPCPRLDHNQAFFAHLVSGRRGLSLGHGFRDLCVSLLAYLDPTI